MPALVDSGLVRRSRFDPALGMARLETVRVTSAEISRGLNGKRHTLSLGLSNRTQDKDVVLEVLGAADQRPVASYAGVWKTGDSSIELPLDLADELHSRGGTILKTSNRGRFAAKVDFATPPYPVAVAAADLNGDGKVDFGDINPFVELLSSD